MTNQEFESFRRTCEDMRLHALQNLSDKKEDKPMDKEPYQRVEVDIEKFTRAAMELQVAVIDAEAQMKDAKQQWIDAEKALQFARNQRIDAETTLVAARGKLQRHLEWVRGLNVTVPLPPGWEEKLGERDE